MFNLIALAASEPRPVVKLKIKSKVRKVTKACDYKTHDRPLALEKCVSQDLTLGGDGAVLHVETFAGSFLVLNSEIS